MLLITGCPRSGTRYLSSALRAVGVRAFHERMGRDGTVNGLFAVDDFYYPGGNQARPSLYKFDNIFHVVRNPLDCIASLMTLDNPRFWHWTQIHTGLRYEDEGRLRYIAKFWSIWNEKVEKLNPEWTFRIESDFWPELLERLGIEQKEIPDVSKSSTTHASVSWDDLGDVAESVRSAAKKYGYA